MPSLVAVSASFKKLMRGCTPSAPQTTYFTAIQDSGWLTQLTHLMQVGGAVADLIDIQGSSVLVCLENGWDTTAQVRSAEFKVQTCVLVFLFSSSSSVVVVVINTVTPEIAVGHMLYAL